ncbi:MAG: DNA topoisomerase IB [Pseudomonadota bacterium]
MQICADLVYYPDSRPGIRRRRRGRGFSYTAPDGTRIADRAERARLNALAVPPAYEGVWISPLLNGHLQATGRDARGRKQYRYHEDWTAFRATSKFDCLPAFGRALPVIRRATARVLAGEPGSQDYAIAAVVGLLDAHSLRVGSPEYAEENRTFGATTLRSHHLRLEGDSLLLSFRGKGGTKIEERVTSKRLSRTLQAVDDLPGAELVSWLDDAGQPRAVGSERLREWLSEVAGFDVTPKTFRTWNGSLAAWAVAERPGPLTIKAMAEAAASDLHNSPTIAQNSYVHPAIRALTEVEEDDRLDLIGRSFDGRPPNMTATEWSMLHFIEGSE